MEWNNELESVMNEFQNHKEKEKIIKFFQNAEPTKETWGFINYDHPTMTLIREIIYPRGYSIVSANYILFDIMNYYKKII